MARTTRTAAKQLTQEQLVEAVVAALQAQSNPTQEKAADSTPSAAPKVPFLSCWTATRISPDPKGQFSHTDKRGTKRDYVALSEAEAIKALKANYRAGRTYAIPA